MQDELVKQHLEKGTFWEQEVYLGLRRSRYIAWVIASIAVIVVILQAFAMMFMAPLKEAVPYVITVDKQSGYVEIAKELDNSKLSKQQALTDYHLANYVQLRESYLNALAAERYHKVQSMSAGDASREHKLLWDGKNPANPSIIYGVNGSIDVEILSVSPLNERTSSVRFVRKVTHQHNIRESTFTAIIVYEYVNKKQSNQERLLNPLGFKVTSYRVVEEYN